MLLLESPTPADASRGPDLRRLGKHPSNLRPALNPTQRFGTLWGVSAWVRCLGPPWSGSRGSTGLRCGDDVVDNDFDGADTVDNDFDGADTVDNDFDGADTVFGLVGRVPADVAGEGFGCSRSRRIVKVRGTSVLPVTGPVTLDQARSVADTGNNLGQELVSPPSGRIRGSTFR